MKQFDTYQAVDRRGQLLFEFAGLQNSQTGERRFDWKNKERFMLNPTQCGTLLATPSLPLTFHNRKLDQESAMFMRKELTFEKTPKNPSEPDDSAYILKFSSKNLGDESGSSSVANSVILPLSHGELAVVRSLIQFSLPYLLGWDQMLQQSPVNDLDSNGSGSSNANNDEGDSSGGHTLPEVDIWGANTLVK